MVERRLLVIGTQCEVLHSDLAFLPQTARDFYDVMTDPDRGACQPALPDRGLLLDPPVDETRDAIQQAYADAGRAGAMLLIAYIGHGEMVKDDFYLLPKDGSSPPREGHAVHLVQVIKNSMNTGPAPAGLLVLVDACFAGIAAVGAAGSWVNAVAGAPGFEMIAAVANRPANGGCFTRTLRDLVDAGLEAIDAPEIRPRDVIDELRTHCESQFPQLPSFNPHPDLFLARNVAWCETRRLPARTASEVERLTTPFQPTRTLNILVDTLTRERAVAIVAPMGSGKSTLLAALARPKVTHGIVPRRFLHAVTFATMGMTPEGLAIELSAQLEKTVDGFKRARAQADAHADAPAADKVPAFERRLLAPLRLIAPTPVRLAIDGLDQLPPATFDAIAPALEALARDEYAHVRLVVTSLPDTRVPASMHRIAPQPPTAKEIKSYLKARTLHGKTLNVITTNAHNNWLVARLLADDVVTYTRPVSRVPVGLSHIYDGRLRDVAAQVGEARWTQDIRPVLEILAVAGTGPIVPVPLLIDVLQRRTGRTLDAMQIGDALRDLRGFVVHEPAGNGSDMELAGVFDATVRYYINDRLFPFIQLDEQAVTRAILDALRTLAPHKIRRADSPIFRFVVAREAELCWAIEDYDALVASLRARQFPVPRDTFAALRGWHRRLKTRLPDSDLRLITLRGHIAHVMGEAGRKQLALRLLLQVHAQQASHLSDQDRELLWTRSQIAHWIGRNDRHAEARGAFEALLPLRRSALGEDDRDTLDTRGEIAHWIGMSGEPDGVQRARHLFKTLVDDDTRILGAEDGDTLTARANLAHWTGKAGDAAAALAIMQELLPVHRRVFGDQHLETLRARNNEAFYLGKVGQLANRPQDLAEARDRLLALFKDAQETLGANHELTVQVELNAARLTGEAGDPQQALILMNDCVIRAARVFGPAHWLTEVARGHVARLSEATRASGVR